MSAERAREFLETTAANPELRARIESAENPGVILVETMHAAGYGDVSVEDLRAAVLRREELGDADLAEVTGGVNVDAYWALAKGYWGVVRATVSSMIP